MSKFKHELLLKDDCYMFWSHLCSLNSLYAQVIVHSSLREAQVEQVSLPGVRFVFTWDHLDLINRFPPIFVYQIHYVLAVV